MIIAAVLPFLVFAVIVVHEIGHLVCGLCVGFGLTSDVDKAGQLLETCMEYSQFSAPVMREALRSDAAIFQARKRNRVDLAEQWLSEVPEKTLLPGLRLRAESAILEAQGDIEGALRKLDEVETALMTVHDSYQQPISLRFVRRWKLELLEKQASGA